MTGLLDALLPQTRLRVMAATFMHPERWWYVRDLARRLGVAPSNAHKELRVLASAGILERREEGMQVYFRANRACPVYPELRGIVRKTVGLVDVLEEALEPVAGKVLVAFVYGSVARGEEAAGSDVDLLLVGKLSLSAVSAALADVQAELLRDVNPTVFSPREFANKIAKRNHFLTSVLAEAKLFVIGTEDELGKASG